jgi:glycosyltransferase involved in cell wall biosynthesis
MKKITIVTVTKNNLKGLIATHESLKDIDFSFDWIIKDSGSTDGTSAYVQNFCNPSRFIEIEDSGIFNGMNIALREVKTEFVFFLNAGDRICSAYELQRCLEVLIDEEKSWLVAGALISSSWSPVGYWETPTFPYLWRYLGLQSWCHQSTIYKSDFLISNGCFDESNLIADWSTALILEQHESPVIRVQPLSIFELGGTSGSMTRSKWVELHTRGRYVSNLLLKNSQLLDKVFISYPTHLMIQKPLLRCFFLPIFAKFLKF